MLAAPVPSGVFVTPPKQGVPFPLQAPSMKSNRFDKPLFDKLLKRLGNGDGGIVRRFIH
jgi:hypothetical protein